MASNSNTIDLTDEDDAKPQTRVQQGNPPALVALNMRRSQPQVVQSQQVRQLVTTQQTIRNAAIAAQNRKLPVIGKFKLFFVDNLKNTDFFKIFNVAIEIQIQV